MTAIEPVHTVTIRAVSRGSYEVTYEGEIILEAAQDPEWQAARILATRGCTGRLQTKRRGSDVVSFDMPLERAAQLSTNGTQGFRAFKPDGKKALCESRAREHAV